MNLSQSIQKWSNIQKDTKIVIVTDEEQKDMALAIKEEGIYDVTIENCSQTEDFSKVLESFKSLKSSDLLIAMFSFDTFLIKGANRFFSPFSKPKGVAAKYIFIRLSISKESLMEGLSTEKKLVYDKIHQMNKFDEGAGVHVTNGSGTDVTFKIHPFTTCSHEITEDGGMAFLPPSETSSEVIEGTANGKIVIDMTVGQLYHFTTLLSYFGLVKTPVTLLVKDGFITDIQGDEMAEELKEKLFSLSPDCRKLVELGQGLSKMKPTGLTGVDESIIDSCHFGFGDGGECGVHLDLVIMEPTIKEVMK